LKGIKLLSIYLLFLSSNAYSQITLTDNRTATQLVQRILGGGITVSNPTLNCTGIANATFVNSTASLGLTGGVVLTTGRAITLSPTSVGINGSSTSSPNNVNFVTTLDPDIQSLKPGFLQRDLCRLEFDFIPKGDTISMNYVFASEEYTTNNCSQFADVIGIFVSGPGIVGNKNIALVPNTTVPVSINSINDGTGSTPTCTSLHPNAPFTALYTANVSTTISYNGFTKVMTATSPVTPFGSYHAKIAIVDISDSLNDSGVFIGEGSFTSEPILELEKSSTGGFTSNPLYAIEGCNPGVVKFKRKINNVPLVVNLNYSGNAVFGTDYTATATSFTIPAGDTIFNYNLTALADNLVENNDSVKVRFTVVGNSYSDSVVYYIKDFATGMSVFNNSNDTTVCFGKPIQLYASNLPLNYNAFWTPNTDLSDPTILNPILTPNTSNGFVSYTIALRINHPGCSFIDSNVIVNIQPSPVLFLGPSPQIICKGDTLELGALITPTGSYTFSWATNPTLSATNILNPKAITLTNQTYYFTATTNIGCSTTDSTKVIVSNVKNEIVNIKIDTTSCGLGNGRVKVTMNGSTPPYQFSFNGGAFVTADTFTGLSSGTFSLKIRNGANCVYDTTITIVAGPPAPKLTLNTFNTTCGNNNGKIKATIIGGVAPISFTWSNGVQSVDSIFNLSPGNYNLTITDSKGCVDTKTASILSSTGVSSNIIATQATCASANGSVNAIITGGVSPYKYIWNTGDTTQNLSNLNAGTYKVTITDNLGCTRVDSISISNSVNVSFSKSITASTCNQANGSISLSNIVGTSPFNFLWSNGANTQNVSNLLPGTYFVTVTDSKLCSRKDTIIISSSVPAVYSLNVVNSKCTQSNGAIQIVGLTGATPFSFLWSNGATTQNISNVMAASYSVSVTDANGCVYEKNTVVQNSSNPSLKLSKTDATCGNSNGSVIANVTNSVGTIIYNWNTGSGANVISNLSSGTYKVTIIDSLGCTKSDSIILNSNPAINISYSKNQPTCGLSNGSLIVNITSGTAPFSFTWNNLDTNRSRTNLSQGTYIVFYRDSFNCNKKDTFVLSPSSKPVTTGTINQAKCSSLTGGVSTTVAGGKSPYKYSWSNSDTTSSIANILPGIFFLTVTDSLGCQDIDTFNILRLPPPSYTDTVFESTCLLDNGSILFTNIVGATPLVFTWSDGVNTTSTSRNGLKKGTYTVEIRDINNCLVKDTFFVDDIGPPSLDLDSIDHTCLLSDGKIISTITGGSSPFTFKMSFTAVGMPPVATTWTNVNRIDTAKNLGSGYYEVIVTDSKGCTDTVSTRVKNNTNIKVTFTATKSRCDTGTAIVTANPSFGTPPYTYRWNNKDSVQTIDSLAEGSYVVTVTDANGCTVEDDTIVAPIYKLTVLIDSVFNTKCDSNNGRVYLRVLNAIGKTETNWFLKSGIIVDSFLFKKGLEVGSYNVMILDSNKCKGTLLNNFEIDKIPIVTHIATVNAENCGKNNGNISLNIDNLFLPTYLWSTGATTNTITNLDTGKYSVIITDKNNCKVFDTFIINELQAPKVVSFTKIEPTCGLSNGTITALINAPAGTDTIIWNNSFGLGQKTLNNRPDGKYVIRVTDPFGCSTKDSINLSGIPKVKLNAVVTHSNCVNGVGSIVLNTRNGTPPYTYVWQDFSSDTNRTNLSSGTYSVTVTDSGGCVTDTTINLLFFKNPTLILNPTNEVCDNKAGKIVPSIFFGTTPFSYSWSNGSTSSQLLNINAGKYVLTLTDSKGCIAIDSASITSTNKPVSTLSSTPASCNLNNGSVMAVTNKGKTPFIYNWNGLYSGSSVSNIDSGRYILTVIDSNLCTFIDTIQVSRIVSVSATLNRISSKCSNSNGSIITTVFNGAAPFKYLWSTGDTTANLTNIKSGQYFLTVTDFFNCSFVTSGIVTDSSGPVIIHTNILATCGQNNGSILSNVSGMNQPFSYFWNNVSGSKDLTGINGGTFIFKVVDSKGCIALDTTVLTPVLPLSNIFSVTNPNCNLLNGKIKSIPSGGKKPYSYSWNTGQAIDSIMNLAPNKYKLTISDAAGCLFNDSSTIIQTGVPSIAFNTTPSTCTNANGKVKATVLGGQSPYKFLWNTGGAKDSLINIVAGNYTLTVTDSNNCAIASIASVSTTGMSSISLIKKDPACQSSNGSIKATPLGGQAPYTFLWNNGAISDSVFNLNPGTYTVTVTDASGCTLSNSVAIVNQASPSVTFGTLGQPFCGQNNGYILSSVSGGKNPITYNWSTGATSAQISNLDSGNYRLIVIDSNGCRDTVSGFLNRTPDVSVANNITKSFCGNPNGRIKAVPTGGTAPYTYSWSTGATKDSIKNLMAGTYLLTVRDGNLCTKTFSIIVDDIPRPLLAPIKEDAVCNKKNGTIDAKIVPNTGTAPFSYLWNTGTTASKLVNLDTGIYTVKVTDVNGCFDTFVVAVNFAINPSLALSATNVVCSDSNGTITSVMTRGIEPVNYIWNTGATTKDLSNLKPGTYIITATDAKSCIVVDTIEITDKPAPDILLNPVLSFCLKSNGAINTSINKGTAPFAFLWSNGASVQNLSNLPQGNYKLTVTDANNCVDTASVSIVDEPNNLRLSLKKKDLLCFEDAKGEIYCTATGGQTPYQYKTQTTSFNRDSIIPNLSAISYDVTVQDDKGCLATGKISLTEPPKIVVSTLSKVNLLCFEDPIGEISVSAVGGVLPYQFVWASPGTNPNTSHISKLKAGVHTLKLTDKNGCEVIYQDSLTQPSEIIVVDSLFNPLCNNELSGRIKIIASGATPSYSYLWNNGATTKDISSLSEGNYKLTITDANLCVDSFSFNLLDPPPITFSKVETVDLPCLNKFDGEIKLQGIGGQGEPYQYSIDGGTTYSFTKNFKNLDSGKYIVVVRDVNNCQFRDTTNINNPENIVINAIPKDTTIDLGKAVPIDFEVKKGNALGINSVLWTPDLGITCNTCKNTLATPYQTTIYDVRITYNAGKCTTSDKLTIRINEDNELFVPDAFTPNGDGDNDVLKVYGLNVKFAKLKIFNRWGEKVFDSSNAIIEGWDGYFLNQLAPPGIYTYSLEAHYLNKKIKTLKGTITLIR
jgi:gliding motility-associated-like protein